MKINPPTIDQWRRRSISFLLDRGLTPAAITTGRDAWNIAHMCGFCIEAYNHLNAHDGHIRTALQCIFPNAVFKDAKRY